MIERNVFRLLVDPAPQLVLCLELRDLRADQAQHDHHAFAHETQRSNPPARSVSYSRSSRSTYAADQVKSQESGS